MLTFEYAEDMEEQTGKVLVVDDEKMILKYLSKSLSLSDIEVFTALSAKEGLEILGNQEIDIVIADFRMPEMNGVEFLKEVRKNYKKVSRILLSGHMEQSSVLKALTSGIATTYFSKPWDDNVLIARIKHTLEIQRILHSKELLELINSISQLPSLPSLYQEFMDAIENESPINKISEIIKKNTSVATKVLQVANSAFYGLQETTSIDYAIIYVGLNPIKDIVLTLSLTSEMSWNDTQIQYLQDIFDHSTLVNRYIPKFYSRYPNAIKFKPFPAVGITHDIGKIILLQYYPERYEAIMKQLKEEPEKNFYDIEILRGFDHNTHAEIGAYFLDWWNLPDVILETALFHHTPKLATSHYRAITAATNFTNRLVNQLTKTQSIDNLDMNEFANDYIPEELIEKVSQDILEDLNA